MVCQKKGVKFSKVTRDSLTAAIRIQQLLWVLEVGNYELL